MLRRIPLSLLAAGGLIFAATAYAQMSLDALQRDGYGIVPIARPQPNVLTVQAQIGGRRARLIIDTGWGGEGLALDAGYFDVVHLVKGDSQLGHTITGQHLSGGHGLADLITLGNAQIRNVPVSLTAVQGMRTASARSSIGADGVIAAGFLHTCSAIIDLPNLRLYLRPPGTGRLASIGPALREIGFAEVPFDINHHTCSVEAQINGVRGAMALDTGSSGGLIDPGFARKANAYGYHNGIALIDAAGVEAEVTVARMSSFKIGGVTPLKATHVGVSPFSGYKETGGKLVGILGMDILGPNGTIIDFGQKKLYFFKAK